MTRHYAPQAELTLYEGPSEAVVRASRPMPGSATAAGRSAWASSRRKKTCWRWRPRSRLAPRRDELRRFPTGRRHDLERSARELFASIRALDATGVAKILAIGVGSDGLARAIHDRLIARRRRRVKTVVQRSFRMTRPAAAYYVVLVGAIMRS